MTGFWSWLTPLELIRPSAEEELDGLFQRLVQRYHQGLGHHVRAPQTIVKRMELCGHQHNQPTFSVWFDSSPSPDTLLLFPSGIGVSGIETGVGKLAEVV